MRGTLIVCGVASSVLYAIVDLTAASTRWPDYSYTAQTVSELIATDAPTRPFVVPWFTLYSLLVITFGVMVWRFAGGRTALRVAGAMLVAKEVEGLLATFVAPIHLRGVAATASDTWHGILTAAGVMCILAAVWFGATAFGRRFRIYSIATVAVLLVCGLLAFLMAPRVTAGEPTPWMGTLERINIYGYLLWVAVFAVRLTRAGERNVPLTSASLPAVPGSGAIRG